MHIDGGCHCGFIKYEAEVDADSVGICHCTDCQTLTGTAYRTTVQSLKGAFKLVSGTPKIYVKTAESGNQARARLLSRMRHADFRDHGGESRGLRHPRRHHAPAPRAHAKAPGLVPLGARLGDEHRCAAEEPDAAPALRRGRGAC